MHSCSIYTDKEIIYKDIIGVLCNLLSQAWSQILQLSCYADHIIITKNDNAHTLAC